MSVVGMRGAEYAGHREYNNILAALLHTVLRLQFSSRRMEKLFIQPLSIKFGQSATEGKAGYREEKRKRGNAVWITVMGNFASAALLVANKER